MRRIRCQIDDTPVPKEDIESIDEDDNVVDEGAVDDVETISKKQQQQQQQSIANDPILGRSVAVDTTSSSFKGLFIFIC